MTTEDDVEIICNGFKLSAGIFMPVEKKEKQDAIIYCSGFPGSIETSKKISKSFSQKGYASIYFDYKGIRDSEGTLDFVSQVDDLKAVITYTESVEGLGRIIVVGHGFGGRVTICTAASDNRVDGCAVWESIGDTREELKQKPTQLVWRLYSALWVKNVRGTEKLLEKLRVAAESLNPIECVKRISPRPVLIIHRRRDFNVAIRIAYELESSALDPKTLILDDGWMHSDDDSFFTSPTRRNGAITYTDNWIKKYVLL